MPKRSATIIRCKGTRTLQKSKNAFTGETLSSYDKCKHFDAKTVSWSGFDGLYRLLAGLENDHKGAIVRAELMNGDSADHVLRRLQGDGAAFVDVPRAWFALDIDGAVMTGHGADAKDVVGVADWLCNKYVPVLLQETTCIVQFTSGHGWELNRVYARIWFHTKEPLEGAALRYWIGTVKGHDPVTWAAMDASICGGVQIHYTAAPAIVGVSGPPIERRLVLFEGLVDEVDAAPIAENWTKYVQERAARRADRAPFKANGREEFLALNALQSIDPDCEYLQWIRVGMALHSKWPGDEGLSLWDEWSSKGASYEPGATDAKWASFRGQGVELATIFGIASDHGWRHPDTDPVKVGRRTEASEDLPDDWTPGEVPARFIEQAPKREDKVVLRVDCGPTGYLFGKQVWKLKREKPDEPLVKSKLLAHDVTPIAFVQDVDSGARSVLLDYRDAFGRAKQATLPMAAWVTAQSCSSASVELAGAGVAIQPKQGGELVAGIGAWAMTEEIPVYEGVATTGWRIKDNGEWAYVAGEDVFGAQWQWTGKEAPARRGDMRRWRREILTLAHGRPAMAFALAVAFAGVAIEPLQVSSFMVHYFGNSSTGKSLATFIGQSVWAPPNRVGSWKDTPNYIAQSLAESSGRSVCLDDVRKATNPKQVSELVLALSDNSTKGRLARTGEMRSTKNFALTLLSSGEQGIGEFLGQHGDVGHAVRCLDVRIVKGDSTVSHDHARAIEMWRATGAGGVAGAEFASAFVRLMRQKKRFGQWRARIDELIALVKGDHDSTNRAAASIALAVNCFELAVERKVCPDLGVSAEELMQWAAGKVFESRSGIESAEKRALTNLLEEISTSPGMYPDEPAVKSGEWRGHTLRGVVVKERYLMATSGQLRELAKRSRVQLRPWLEWLAENGAAKLASTVTRVAGKPNRYHEIDLERCRRF